MRKLKLLLAACALFGVSAAWAQTDVTDTYITNADFSSTDGWTFTSGGGTEHNEGCGLIGTLKLNDKISTTDETHLATEYCFGFSARWNGRYTYCQQTITSLPSGIYTISYDIQDVNTSSTKYTMDNYFYVEAGGNQYLDKTTEWMDAGASNWTTHTISFTLNEPTDVTLSLGYGNKENKGSTDCPAIYVSHLKLEKILANKTELEATITNATNINAVLADEGLTTAITTAQGIYDKGTATQTEVDNQVTALVTAITTAYGNIADGKDLTGFIVNAAVANGTGWTNPKTASNQQYTGAPDNTYFDCGWSTSANCYQTVNLPAGYYVLKAATRAASSDVTSANIYANNNTDESLNKSTDNHRDSNTGGELGNGWSWTEVKFSVPTTTNITIGFYAQTTGHGWAGADDFHLTYYKSETSFVAGKLAEKVAEAKAITAIPTAAKNALKEVIEANDNDDDAFTTVGEFETAIENIEVAITTAKALIAPYAAYLSAKAGMDAVALVPTTDNEKAASRKAEYLDAVSDEAEAATTAEAINTAVGKIKAAVVNYVKKLTPADAENTPFDLTFMITNPSFSENTMTGWKGTTPNFGNDDTQKAAKACEYYEKEFDIFQTLTDMATGSYRLKVKAYQRPGGSGDIVPAYVNADDKKDGTFGTTSEIYVNGGNEGKQAIKNAASPMITTKVGSGSESEVEVSGTKYYIPNDMVSAVAYFAAGHYENTTDIIATTTSITFGFRSTANHVGYDWTIFDDFRLYYTGQLDLSVFQTSLDAKVTEAGEVKTELTGKVPASVLTALQDVVDANDNDDSAFDDEEQFTTAIANINAAITAAQGAEAPYTAWKALKAKADVLVAVNNDNNEANGTFGTTIDTQNGIVEAATEGATIESATSALKTAMATYCGVANPVGDGAKFDMTFMLTNPDLTGLGNGEKDGWYCDQNQPSQNSQAMTTNNSVANKADNTKYAFYEYWSNNTEPTEGYVVYQKLNLPEGTYKMEALAYAGYGGGHRYGMQTDGNHSAGSVSGEGVIKITFSAGETDGTWINTNTLEDASIEFVQTAEGEVKIGLKAHEGNQSNWMGIGYVKLFKVQPKTFTIDEGVDYDTAQEGAGAVTLKRTIKADTWNTIWLPFSMTTDELKSTFGDEVQVAEYEEIANGENSTINFNVMATPAISPLTPVLLKTPTAGSSYTIQARTMVAGAPAINGTNFDFVGSYAASTTIAAGDYFFNSNKLYKSTGQGSTIKGTRAYIKAKSEGARITNFVIDGEETTGIMNVEQGTVSLGKVYNMQGQQVKNAQKGIFIQNGKKFVIK